MDIVLELQDNLEKLNKCLQELKMNGIALAEAEKTYKIILRQECLKLRDEGMAVGMIDKTCYGIPVVAEARFNRDVAEAKYKANMEAINTYKLTIKILQDMIDKEFYNGNEV